ncbi:hypothetical protein EDB83DRAFT_1509366 [Lactarius deliciosus]|nr:hypothetical protein EDB83DRAFT_1509366 [Lactarius deliciosus]
MCSACASSGIHGSSSSRVRGMFVRETTRVQPVILLRDDVASNQNPVALLPAHLPHMYKEFHIFRNIDTASRRYVFRSQIRRVGAVQATFSGQIFYSGLNKATFLPTDYFCLRFDGRIRIWFFVEGKDLYHKIIISEGKDVADLKTKIHEEGRHSHWIGVDAIELVLFQVDIDPIPHRGKIRELRAPDDARIMDEPMERIQ